MSTNPSEELVIMSNLQQIRFHRPWIDCEFMLYQKLCHTRNVLLDFQLDQIKAAHNKLKKEQRESSRNANSKTI